MILNFAYWVLRYYSSYCINNSPTNSMLSTDILWIINCNETGIFRAYKCCMCDYWSTSVKLFSASLNRVRGSNPFCVCKFNLKLAYIGTCVTSINFHYIVTDLMNFLHFRKKKGKLFILQSICIHLADNKLDEQGLLN